MGRARLGCVTVPDETETLRANVARCDAMSSWAPHTINRVNRVLLILTLGLLLASGAESAVASRGPTYLERVTMMDAFNVPGRSFSSRCVRIVVSTVDPRYAMVTSPRRPVQACVDAGEVGDGYALFRRPTRKSLKWRNIGEGSETPCFLPAAVRRDLFPSSSC